MKSILQFLKEFNQRSGWYVMTGMILEKLTNFLISWVLILVLDKTDLGQLTYAQSVFIFFFTLTGFGSNSALLQIGSGLKSTLQKYHLINYAFTWGIRTNIVMIFIALIVSFLLADGSYVLITYFILLAVQIIPQYISEFQSCWYQMSFKNKELFQYDIRKMGLQLALSLLLIYFFKVYGYLVALILTPIFVFVFYRIKFPIRFEDQWQLKQVTQEYFWKFSLFTGFSNVISQLVFIVDAIIIFRLLGEEANAEYRVASILPFNILFIPRIFMKADYPTIAKNKYNKKFLVQYYSRFLMIMFLSALIIFMIGYYFGEQILSIFGKQYQPYQLFIVLLFSSCIAMMLRVPMGNIISALGRSSFNFYNSIATIILDIVLNLYLIPIYGLMGAAYATAISLVFSGVISVFYFIGYLATMSADTEDKHN